MAENKLLTGKELCEIADKVNDKKAEDVVDLFIPEIMTMAKKAAEQGDYQVNLSIEDFKQMYDSGQLTTFIVKKFSNALDKLGFSLKFDRQTGEYTVYFYSGD